MDCKYYLLIGVFLRADSFCVRNPLTIKDVGQHNRKDKVNPGVRKSKRAQEGIDQYRKGNGSAVANPRRKTGSS